MSAARIFTTFALVVVAASGLLPGLERAAPPRLDTLALAREMFERYLALERANGEWLVFEEISESQP